MSLKKEIKSIWDKLPFTPVTAKQKLDFLFIGEIGLPFESFLELVNTNHPTERNYNLWAAEVEQDKFLRLCNECKSQIKQFPYYKLKNYAEAYKAYRRILATQHMTQYHRLCRISVQLFGIQFEHLINEIREQ